MKYTHSLNLLLCTAPCASFLTPSSQFMPYLRPLHQQQSRFSTPHPIIFWTSRFGVFSRMFAVTADPLHHIPVPKCAFLPHPSEHLLYPHRFTLTHHTTISYHPKSSPRYPLRKQRNFECIESMLSPQFLICKNKHTETIHIKEIENDCG